MLFVCLLKPHFLRIRCKYYNQYLINIIRNKMILLSCKAELSLMIASHDHNQSNGMQCDTVTLYCRYNDLD